MKDHWPKEMVVSTPSWDTGSSAQTFSARAMKRALSGSESGRMLAVEAMAWIAFIWLLAFLVKANARRSSRLPLRRPTTSSSAREAS